MAPTRSSPASRTERPEGRSTGRGQDQHVLLLGVGRSDAARHRQAGQGGENDSRRAVRGGIMTASLVLLVVLYLPHRAFDLLARSAPCGSRLDASGCRKSGPVGCHDHLEELDTLLPRPTAECFRVAPPSARSVGERRKQPFDSKQPEGLLLIGVPQVFDNRRRYQLIERLLLGPGPGHRRFVLCCVPLERADLDLERLDSLTVVGARARHDRSHHAHHPQVGHALERNAARAQKTSHARRCSDRPVGAQVLEIRSARHPERCGP